MTHQKVLSLAALVLSVAFIVHGYPNASAEPSINLGSNPLVSAAGNSSGVLFTAPSDQLIVVTDIIITASGSNSYHPCVSTVSMTTSTGTTLAQFQITADTNASESSSHPGGNISHSFVGGLPVMVNEEVSIGMSGNCTVNYVVAGKYTAL
ncbi:MAG: hypothetical protein CL916_06195 [Deltaproteobacteria bacterium]|nr:hypothetical protein [Deltaproteobacteria bacterium]